MDELYQKNRSRGFDLRRSNVPFREVSMLVKIDGYSVGSWSATVFLGIDELLVIE